MADLQMKLLRKKIQKRSEKNKKRNLLNIQLKEVKLKEEIDDNGNSFLIINIGFKSANIIGWRNV